MRRPIRWWHTVLPTVLYLVHSLCLGDWIIDDAAISFAYARNLAEGHGLVSYPGLDPVEGYSNPTWVLIRAAMFACRLFDAVWTPKIIALVCATLMVWLLLRLAKRPVIGCAAAVLLALNPSFVIWCCSGLENSLYALLVTTLLRISLCLVSQPTVRTALAAAILAGLVAATRPDGLVFAGGKLCRSEITARNSKVRGAFKWAAGEELVPASVLLGLDAVEALGPDDFETHDNAPREDVAWSVVEKTLPFISTGGSRVAVRYVHNLIERTRATVRWRRRSPAGTGVRGSSMRQGTRIGVGGAREKMGVDRGRKS